MGIGSGISFAPSPPLTDTQREKIDRVLEKYACSRVTYTRTVTDILHGRAVKEKLTYELALSIIKDIST